MHGFNDLIIYHMYSLTAAGAPYTNDFSKVEHRLDEIAKWVEHIKRLGCNAVMLSPVQLSSSHGYDVIDYFKIDNRLGTNDDFKSLVKRFHDAGILVILDCVFNHCGRGFFAFDKLRKGEREYAQWFCGVDFNANSPYDDGFSYEGWSGHYELVKFNLFNDKARSYLFESAEFLIKEFDIDGMRLDSANVIDLGFMRELRSITKSIKPSFWLMGEVVSGDYTRFINDETLDSVTGYMLYKALYSSHNENNLYELAHTVSSSKPDFGISHYNFLDNHDQPRISSIVKDRELLYTLYTLLFTLPGIPSIYYGSEWELKAQKQHGSDLALRPYIDIQNPPPQTGITEHIRKLAQIRASRDSLKRGGYRQLYLEYHRPYVFEREYDGESSIVAVNIGANAERLSLGDGLRTDCLSGNTIDMSNINMPPYSSLILVSRM